MVIQLWGKMTFNICLGKLCLKRYFRGREWSGSCKPRMLAKAKRQETPLQVRRAAVDSWYWSLIWDKKWWKGSSRLGLDHDGPGPLARSQDLSYREHSRAYTEGWRMGWRGPGLEGRRQLIKGLEVHKERNKDGKNEGRKIYETLGDNREWPGYWWHMGCMRHPFEYNHWDSLLVCLGVWWFQHLKLGKWRGAKDMFRGMMISAWDILSWSKLSRT